MNETTARNLAVALRPSSFQEFIGSESIISQLQSQLDTGRIPTAYLLSGPTGCGKTTLARCIAQAIDGELLETNAADDTGIDMARILGEQAQYRSLTNKYKVIVLDEAHQLTKQAQNALLKHVEEAPPTTLWIFSTTEATKLIPTLRGRCVSYTLGGLRPEEVKTLVKRATTYLGGVWEARHEAFVASLVSNAIFSPRAVLMALERFVGGLDVETSIFGTADSPAAIEIARATFKQDWKTVKGLLSTATNEEAITIRIICVNYFKSALLKSNGSLFYSTAILELTKTIPTIDIFGLAELCVRIWKICAYSGSK